jgi:hypothetical protein
MYRTTYRSLAYRSWRFTQPRSVQPAASVRSIQGGMPHARTRARLRTPLPTRLRA